MFLESKGHEVSYSRKINDNTKIQEADYIIMPTSIIAHETEKSILNSLLKQNKKFFLIGIFANVMNNEYRSNNSYIVKGEPETGAFLADDLERIAANIGGVNIAACIVEPIAGSTGALVPPKG